MNRITMFVFVAVASWQAVASEIDVHVVTAEDEKPIAGAKITATFEGILALGHEMDEVYERKTNSKGYCHFTGVKNNPHVYIELIDRAKKPKYYRTCQKVELKRAKDGEPPVVDYHSVTLRVQKVGKPIPMFVKEVESPYSRKDLFAEGSDQVSYDLIAADWLPPQGTGTVADIVFTRYERESLGDVTNRWGEVRHLSRLPLKVTFPGEGNGVVKVESPTFTLQVVPNAPEDGYEHDVMSYAWMDEDGRYRRTWYPYGYRTYCFRIRTQTDENGKVIGGYYGRVDDGFEFDYVMLKDGVKIPIGEVSFRYALNLTPLSRNLEWDCRNNLNPEE